MLTAKCSVFIFRQNLSQQAALRVPRVFGGADKNQPAAAEDSEESQLQQYVHQNFRERQQGQHSFFQSWNKRRFHLRAERRGVMAVDQSQIAYLAVSRQKIRSKTQVPEHGVVTEIVV